MAKLRELAAGRADLLAEVAGIFVGTSEGELDEPLARQAAGLCCLSPPPPRWARQDRTAAHGPTLPPPSRAPVSNSLRLRRFQPMR